MEGDARVLECPRAGKGPLEGGRARPVPSPAMKVVFDSNILIAALLFPGGRSEAAVANILDGVDDLLISRPLIQEVLAAGENEGIRLITLADYLVKPRSGRKRRP